MISALCRLSPPPLGTLTPRLKVITPGPQPQTLLQFVPGPSLGFPLYPASLLPAPCSSGEPSCTCSLNRMPGAPYCPPPSHIPPQGPGRLLTNSFPSISQCSCGLSTDCPFVPCQAGATSRAQLAPDCLLGALPTWLYPLGCVWACRLPRGLGRTGACQTKPSGLSLCMYTHTDTHTLKRNSSTQEQKAKH